MTEITLEQAVKIARESGWTGIYTAWSSPTEKYSMTVPVTPEQFHDFAKAIQAQTRREVLEEAAKVCDKASLDYWSNNFPEASGACLSNADQIRNLKSQEQSKETK